VPRSDRLRRRFFGCAPAEQVLAELARGGEIVASPDDVARPVDVEVVRTEVAASRCHGCPPSREDTRRRGSAAPDTSLPRLSRRDPISRRDDGGKAPWDVRPGCRTRMCGSLRMSSGVSRMTTRQARGFSSIPCSSSRRASASNGARYSRRGDRSAASEPRSTYHEWYVILDDVPWGVVELEPEVATWIGRLSDEEFGRVEFYIDLLEEKGVRLREPYTRQLR